MRINPTEMNNIIRTVIEGPKQDNSSYLRAISDARKAFEDAEAYLGGPVSVKSKVKAKQNGKYVVKWTFERAD
jgi:hypothetical protein